MSLSKKCEALTREREKRDIAAITFQTLKYVKIDSQICEFLQLLMQQLLDVCTTDR